ncbi:calpain-9-like [Paramacrobiotus metropolitanus]|uniref:calpain-9-like n=1 Tax=Paramacrobiotus metropolitanus TaxID=2943436 RepID=UPI002445732A|nr:calpain-9-like [Paramacrobiotus metropolitanus]
MTEKQYKTKLHYVMVNNTTAHAGATKREPPIITYSEYVTRNNTSSNGKVTSTQVHAKPTEIVRRHERIADIPVQPPLDINGTTDYTQIAAKLIKKFANNAKLPAGCLYSSSSDVKVAKGADLVDGGASQRPVARLEYEKRSAAGDVGPTAAATNGNLRKPVPIVSAPLLAPKTIPFGHVGGSSRRGYTINKRTFEQLRDDCFRNGKLFEDPDFPATDRSVFPTQRYNRHFEWKRPTELAKNPQLIVDGAKRFDIVQGELGNCWLLAAVADLTLNEKLLERVVPLDQGFSKAEKYCGIFHFRFWQYGQWVDVVIDDRLPTVNGRLMFMQSRDTNEFWTALLEKAYAKVNGSYENLRGGTDSEAMEDFTGGLAENYALKTAPQNLFLIIQRSFELGALMSCSIEATTAQIESRLPNGLVMGHAYSVTDVKLIDVHTSKPGKIPCLRLRNPWGESEWKGAFSDGSAEWKYVPERVRKQLEVSFAEDGEFWIPYSDLMQQFSKFEICNLGPETMVAADGSFARKHAVRWEANVFSGSWTRGVSAGGCRNYLTSFHLNPQYRITLREADGPDGLATCIVALMQKERRKLRSQGLDLLTVGFAIYNLPKKAPIPLNTEFFRYNASVARAPAFVNSRQVTTRFRLPPGDYCIIPSTFEPHEEGDFLLRVYSEIPIEMREHDNSPREIASVVLKDVPVISQSEMDKETELVKLFHDIAGKEQEIDVNELAAVLRKGLKTHFDFKGFSPEIVRSMVTMSDVDFSGKLGLDEFMGLWETIKQWKDIFARYDTKNEGKIQMENLREAMESAGYLVNSHVLRVIALRYGQSDRTITFEDFILCVVRLRRMISIFRTKDELGLNSAIFSFDDWLLNTMYT